jgi:hypothetical protein
LSCKLCHGYDNSKVSRPCPTLIICSTYVAIGEVRITGIKPWDTSSTLLMMSMYL